MHSTKHWIMLWSKREGNAGKVSPSTFWRSDRRRRLPAWACTPFLWTWKEEIPPSLPGPMPSLLSFFVFMWWSAWKWSQDTVVLQNLRGSLAEKSGKSYYSETTNFMKSRMSISIVRATHYASEDHASPPWATWASGRKEPASQYLVDVKRKT